MTDAGPVPAFPDRRPLIWTYTMLSTYDNVCPHQAAEKYVYKNIPYVASPQQDWGNKVHRAMDERVNAKKPLPADMHTFEPFAAPFDQHAAKGEQKLAVTREGRPCAYFDKTGNIWGRGVIDVTVIHGETAYLNDWKSGAQKLKYESPFELECHAVLLHAANPQLKAIKGTYTYLGQNVMSKVFDLSDTLATWKKIGLIVSKIENDMKARYFEKRQGPLCGWCEVESCEFNTRQDRLAREKAA